MSHEHTDAITCPNCGSQAYKNYCAQCGQSTHLHKETFWGMVMHFVAHYFHYDSKFSQTIKTLLFKPGKLTIAYWQKQRMRYLPPISLYIFISAVFFLVQYATGSELITLNTGKHEKVEQKVTVATAKKVNDEQAKGSENFLDKRVDEFYAKHEDPGAFITEKVNHDLPKIFFFMIPVIAMLLKIVFLKRKELFFVDHAIFSLHYQSFFFSLFGVNVIVSMLLPVINSWINLLTLIVVIIYPILALIKVYKIKWFKAVLCTLFMDVGYAVFLAVGLIIDLFFRVLLG